MELDKCRRAFSEVYGVIISLEENLQNKISKKFMEFLIKNKDENYNFVFDSKLPIDKQLISEDAKILLTIIYKDYIATEEEKEKLIKAWKENDRKHEEKLRNKYDIDKIFEESKDKNILMEENSLIDIKESKVFLTRVIKRLIEFFNK